MQQWRHEWNLLNGPPHRDMGTLKSIELISCGYNEVSSTRDAQIDIFNPPALRATQQGYSRRHGVIKRMRELAPMMMTWERACDDRIGTILTRVRNEETDILQYAHGLEFGWGDDPKQFENLEDGQPIGGTGRFSGILRREDDVPIV